MKVAFIQSLLRRHEFFIRLERLADATPAHSPASSFDPGRSTDFLPAFDDSELSVPDHCRTQGRSQQSTARNQASFPSCPP
jgi:hypothetical protein